MLYKPDYPTYQVIKKYSTNSKHVYEKALQEAGHHTDLKYTPKHENNNSRQHQRKRRITWFNPPFSQHVKTNIGKKFLNLIDKNFPKENELHKICNRNTLKLSYSCMDNMETIIKAHNSKIINKDHNKNTGNMQLQKERRLSSTWKNALYKMSFMKRK